MTYPYENNQFNRKTSCQNCTTHILNTCDMKKNNNFQSKLWGSHSVEKNYFNDNGTSNLCAWYAVIKVWKKCSLYTHGQFSIMSRRKIQMNGYFKL